MCQLCFKSDRSVTRYIRLFVCCFNMQATNYVLAHQEEDSAGEIETKLIKVRRKLNQNHG